jgi:hypothetical protein
MFKQKFTEYLHRGKAWSLVQMRHFGAFFWRKKAQWTDKFAMFLHRGKVWSRTQMRHFGVFFWCKMARWTDKLATFSRQKAEEKTSQPLSLAADLNQQTVPPQLAKVLKALGNEIRNSRKLLENLAIQQTEINGKMGRLESQSLPIKPLEKEPVAQIVPAVELPERITVELSNELRAYLEKLKLFDEPAWLALWHDDPDICEFTKRLLREYSLLENREIEIYNGIAAWLEKVISKQKVQLIIPEPNHSYESSQHELVEQRPVKGPINRILEVKQPGLLCIDTVLLKARVVSS